VTKRVGWCNWLVIGIVLMCAPPSVAGRDPVS
jgi:hypothetical protein